jgi:hypothetical protein
MLSGGLPFGFRLMLDGVLHELADRLNSTRPVRMTLLRASSNFKMSSVTGI